MSLFETKSKPRYYYLSVSAVVCSRRGTYDAELQVMQDSGDKPVYKHVLLQAGYKTHEKAQQRASAEAEDVYNIMWSHARDYLTSKYKDAKE